MNIIDEKVAVARREGHQAAEDGVSYRRCPYGMKRLPERAAWRNAWDVKNRQMLAELAELSKRKGNDDD